MKVIYARVSTKEQNLDRQTEKGGKIFSDVCSGSIPFKDRLQAKKLISFLKSTPEAKTEVKSVDRLGRDMKDILSTIELFKKNNWYLRIEDLGIDNTSSFFDLMIGLMGTLAEHERKTINERAQQGREIAKIKGDVYLGRKKGTSYDRETLLSKHSDIVAHLKLGEKEAEILRKTGKSRTTIRKIKSIL